MHPAISCLSLLFVFIELTSCTLNATKLVKSGKENFNWDLNHCSRFYMWAMPRIFLFFYFPDVHNTSFELQSLIAVGKLSEKNRSARLSIQLLNFNLS